MTSANGLVGGDFGGLEAAARFFDACATDEDLRDAWVPLTTMQEVTALAQSRGYSVTVMEMTQYWSSLADPAQAASGELTDDELDLVSGGASRGNTGCTGTQCTTCCNSTRTCSTCVCPVKC